MNPQDTFQATVNETFDFAIDHQSSPLDMVANGDQQWHILQNHQSFHAHLVAVNYAKKQFHFHINGADYHVQLADKFDQLVQKMGLSVNVNQQAKDIPAPMPGLVLDILVEVGQEVAAKTPLLILEAMKMENVIKATGEGVVQSIEVQKGMAVDKGQLMIMMA